MANERKATLTERVRAAIGNCTNHASLVCSSGDHHVDVDDVLALCDLVDSRRSPSWAKKQCSRMIRGRRRCPNVATHQYLTGDYRGNTWANRCEEHSVRDGWRKVRELPSEAPDAR